MHAYLINLDRSPERLATMDARLRHLGIAYERVPAIDGRRLPPRPGSRLSAGERGCLLSHMETWRMIAERGEPYALVLEDDALLSPRLPSFLADISWIPDDAGVIKLDTTGKPVLVDDRPRTTKAGANIVSLRSPHMGTSAYVISARAARSLAARDSGRPVDVALFELPHSDVPGATYQVDPALCRQDGGSASAIAEDRKQLRRQRGHVVYLHLAKAATFLRRRLDAGRALAGRKVVRKIIPFADR